jgi:hypothetical protein
MAEQQVNPVVFFDITLGGMRYKYTFFSSDVQTDKLC